MILVFRGKYYDGGKEFLDTHFQGDKLAKSRLYVMLRKRLDKEGSSITEEQYAKLRAPQVSRSDAGRRGRCAAAQKHLIYR